MFNWTKNKFAQKTQDSAVVKSAVDVVFSEKFGADTLRGGNPEYEQMMETAQKAAQPVINNKWSSHDDVYQAAKKATQKLAVKPIVTVTARKIRE